MGSFYVSASMEGGKAVNGSYLAFKADRALAHTGWFDIDLIKTAI